ncbi:MAG: D-tyrosyl-tRNA(Tyr) deacylase [Bacteroidaceae bacterium]|nr:D-tyrosyl-tRNA(Tyr) deacylase [Bacteroidaceae bacterium]
MRIVIQRVRHAEVTIAGEVVGRVGQGMLILVGIEEADTPADVQWLVAKTAALRIFDDDEGVMNRSLIDINGEALVVSQFTLMASTKKGNRPSWFRAAGHEHAVPLYNLFVEQLEQTLSRPVPTGRFGADMQVSLLNDGPVTIIIDSKNRE